jgi:hypothetical protein
VRLSAQGEGIHLDKFPEVRVAIPGKKSQFRVITKVRRKWRGGGGGWGVGHGQCCNSRAKGIDRELRTVESFDNGEGAAGRRRLLAPLGC